MAILIKAIVDVKLNLLSYCIGIMITLSNSIETTFAMILIHPFFLELTKYTVSLKELLSDINLNYLAMLRITHDSNFPRSSIVSQSPTVEHNLFISIEHTIIPSVLCLQILILNFNGQQTRIDDEIKQTLQLCIFVALLFTYCVTILAN